MGLMSIGMGLLAAGAIIAAAWLHSELEDARAMVRRYSVTLSEIHGIADHAIASAASSSPYLDRAAALKTIARICIDRWGKNSL